jgi:uncharacterized membrane protein YkvA (DUF1232 family)
MKRPKTDYRGFYENLVDEIKQYKGGKAAIVELAPTLFKFMTNLLEDHRTPRSARPLINAAIAYFVAPYDVLPEEVYGAEGFIDDIYLCLHVIKILAASIDRELLEDNWEGDEPLFEAVDDVYALVANIIGKDREKVLDYVGLD